MKGLSLPRSLSPRCQSPLLASPPSSSSVFSSSTSPDGRPLSRSAGASHHTGLSKTASLPVHSGRGLRDSSARDAETSPKDPYQRYDNEVRRPNDDQDQEEDEEMADDDIDDEVKPKTPEFGGSKIAAFFPKVVTKGNVCVPVAYF